ncbi:asparagine synthase (glutamine-hydrolyzing) [Porphyrobacter sp. SLTP]|nr:asparagine synthase (glutamine-hydrolyzing) [Porphyrobacter sp. SLTP]
MCGMNGIFAYNHSANLPDRSELLTTRDHMRARGPDGFGEWWNGDRRLGLGHRRLSILDLSDRASQPMVSECGRFVVVFNGEIYNYPILREQLEAQGRSFQTTSDTEVLLHLYALKGADMVHDLRGMFAFAIWDNEARGLFLARDAYGIKPLYTANDGWTFRFASQVKALLAGGKVSRDPEPAGVVGFHIWGSVPEPFTLYREIRQLPAGHTQYVDAAGPREPQCYCSISAILSAGADAPAPASAAQECVRAAVKDSVRAHLLADVEVGIFLSKGVDSGALLGLSREAGHDKMRALTLGYDEYQGTADDETSGARQVADLYGAEHATRIVRRQEFCADLPAILEAMDQPSIDGVNTWFVAKAASEQGLKVAISGVGGDELLAGYPSFTDVPRAVQLFALPAAIPGIGLAWRGAAQLLQLAKSRPKVAGLGEYGGTYPGAYLLRRAIFLPFELSDMLEPALVSEGLRRLDILGALQSSMSPAPKSRVSRVAALESSQYLRNQLLRDADWAGMAHGVEIRTPLVDIDLLREVSPLLPSLKPGDGKRFLSNAPNPPLPSSLVNAPKTGFTTPLATWLSEEGEQASVNRGLTSRRWARGVLDSFRDQRKIVTAVTQPYVAVAGMGDLESVPV